jgi:hypothetical protein
MRNNFKNRVLSLLLFTFSFFIIHDYFVVQSTSEVISQTQNNERTDNSSSALKLSIHDTIHTILALNSDDEIIFFLPISKLKSCKSITAYPFYINIIPQRPPLV